MTLKSIKFSILLAITLLALASCSTNDNGYSSNLSQPRSIYNLRKVTIKKDLLFGETVIPGIVTSDTENGNLEDNYLVIQDPENDAAIIFQVEKFEELSFQIGDNVFINLDGATMIEENGEKYIKNIAPSNIFKVNSSKNITPKNIDISTLKEKGLSWGPVLIKIDNVVLTGGEDGKYKGEINILDEFNSNAILKILSNSDLTEVDLIKNINSLVGLPRFINDELFIFPRNINDIIEKDTINILTEGFESSGADNGYKDITAQFDIGSWTISGGITATTGHDKKIGNQSIRLQGTIGDVEKRGIIEMNFDLENVMKVGFYHGIYPAGGELANTNPTTIALEISVDNGATYEQVGEVTVAIRDKEDSTIDFSEFEITETEKPVRFRFVNTSTPFENGNRPRVNIDGVTFTINTAN